MKNAPVTRVGLIGIIGTLLALGCNEAGSPQTTARAQQELATTQASDSTAAATPADSTPAILFVGTSLTAGFGLPSPEQAFPALIQKKLDSAGYHVRVLNAGVSGETSAGGLHKADWLLERPFRILVLELGANDGLRGLDVNALKDNLQQFIDKAHAKYPDARIVVVGMEAPPNLGPRYTRQFHDAFREVAAKNHTALVPFLLEGVGGKSELNQDDGIHPNPEGHRILADNVWKTLEPIVQDVARN
jgi:acyl-CoA thioesterase-1